MLHYLGLVLVLASWVAAAILIFKWRDKDLSTISKHAASTRKATLLFATVLIGLGLPFYYWILAWLVPHLQLDSLFKVVLFLTIALQIVTALIPDIMGWRRLIHRFSAFSMALLYLPMALLIINAPLISSSARVIAIISVFYMISTFILIAILGRAKRNYLIFQTLYVVSMQVVILSGAYIN